MIYTSRTLFTVATFSLLLLSGCGQPAPGLGGGSGNVYDTDTVSIDESGYGGAKHNSSSDGFQSLYFDFDSYSISSTMDSTIAKDAAVARKAAGRKIKLEGNCDEFGTDEYNYALGLKRAKAVKDAMVMQGVPASQMIMVSYGESNPACTAATDECYAQNRRVDLRLAK
jgi:peptidoglycan-associated lipoprotein